MEVSSSSPSPTDNPETGDDNIEGNKTLQSETTDHHQHKSILQQQNSLPEATELQINKSTTSSGANAIKNTTDLKGTKTELFNKLISSQSHQMIVTTPTTEVKIEPPDNLYRTNSLNAHSSKKNASNVIVNSKNTPLSSSKSTSQSSNVNLIHQISFDEFKNNPVVFTRTRSRWYTNEEVAAILTNFSSHPEWQTNELKVRPQSGAVLLYSREKVRYRQDGYCWKKRKNGRTTREDHMKLKVQGVECIYGCYVHSAILPTFHRRCYWLLQNPDIVLVHYLNQPPDDQNKMMITFNPSTLEADTRRSWTNEEIIEEIGSVFGGISQIQHTLNINFPQQQPTTVIQTSQQCPPIENQTKSKSDDSDKMVESNPNRNVTTTNSSSSSSINNNNSQQVYMTIIDNRQSSIDQCEVDKNNNVIIAQEQPDELMTSLSSDRDDENSSIDNGCLKQQQLQSSSAAGRFDMVNEFSVEINVNSSNRNELAFVADNYGSVNNNNLVERNNNPSLGGHSDDDNKQQQMEQNPCSPVTQIYNKIVDDIETYALPLEPDQFNANHHHHHHLQNHNLSISSLPIQTMDITTDTVGCRPSDQHLHNRRTQLIDTTLDSHRISQTASQMLNDVDDQSMEKQYTTISCETGEVIKDLTSCSMDLAGCDLFNEGANCQTACHNVEENANDLLIGDFNMQTSDSASEPDRDSHIESRPEMCNNVVETLSNVDDLRDLMMSNNVVDNSNLLVDSNSFDLFSFKPIDCDNQTIQQLDVKSSTSDTEALARLSPMLIGPRCNSTGNALQPSLLNNNYHHSQQQQHFSSHFLSSKTHDNSTLTTNNFCDFQNNEIANSMRSSSTNPSHSTSYSSNSLPRSATGVISDPDGSQYSNSLQCNTSTTGPSLIKLPLQQRQNSEQQEPCNSVLSSLLPKALSLDGGDLSNTSRDHSNHRHRRHRLSTSPIISYENLRERQPDLCIKYENPESIDKISVTSSRKISDDSQVYLNQTSTIATDIRSSSLLPILDYVPNWCTITGGAKVLIVGNWSSLLVGNSNSSSGNVDFDRDDVKGFSVMFDDLIVPATLIMDNVLRCYVPSHEPGFISLKVLYMDCIVSEQVLFEMRPSCTNTHANIQIQGSSYSPSDLKNNNQSGGGNRYNTIDTTTINQSNNGSIMYNNYSNNGSEANKTNRVLTLAENIISAMHRKNSHFHRHLNSSRLVNSLDIESLDNYRSHNQHRHHSHRSYTQYGYRASQRSLTTSRSLSRESEPPSSSSYAINYGVIEGDPYWHQNPIDVAYKDNSGQQGLSVHPDQQIMTNYQQTPINNTNPLNSFQTYSSYGGTLHNNLVQFVQQKPNLSLNSNHQSTSETQNLTETSSSGLGSIVSSLSPSPSSLHSPTSVCCVNGLFRQDHGGESPCSCENQSSGTPTSADFCEYFQASAKTEETFASLTLNDREQQELYEAAKTIQKAYRTYRGRKRQASELAVETSSVFADSMQLVPDYDSQPSTSLQAASGCNLPQTSARFQSVAFDSRHYQQGQQVATPSSMQTANSATFVKCYRDKEMQAATIIQAYYRRYRQYVHFKIQEKNLKTFTQVNSLPPSKPQMASSGCNHRLVVEPIPVVIDKATTSHVDRKRFKTAAILCSSNGSARNSIGQQAIVTYPIEGRK